MAGIVSLGVKSGSDGPRLSFLNCSSTVSSSLFEKPFSARTILPLGSIKKRWEHWSARTDSTTVSAPSSIKTGKPISNSLQNSLVSSRSSWEIPQIVSFAPAELFAQPLNKWSGELAGGAGDLKERQQQMPTLQSFCQRVRVAFQIRQGELAVLRHPLAASMIFCTRTLLCRAVSYSTVVTRAGKAPRDFGITNSIPRALNTQVEQMPGSSGCSASFCRRNPSADIAPACKAW